MFIKWLGLPIGLLVARIFPVLDWKLCVLVALSSTLYINSIVTRILIRRKARKLGCGPLYRRKHTLPFGIDSVQRAIKADREYCVPDEFNRIFNEVKQGSNATYEQVLLGTTVTFTADPKNIQAILATQFNDFELGSLRRDSFYALLGNGIFTADGKFWEHSRAMLRPQFTRDQVGDLDLEEMHVQHMFKHLPTKSDGWTDKVNLGPLFFRLTLDSATEFLFGQSVQSQIAALPNDSLDKQHFEKRGGLEWDKMGRCFDEATHGLGHRARYTEMWWLYSPKSFFDNCKEVHRFADYYVQLALNKDLYDNDELYQARGGKRPKYIFLAELVKSTRDPKELRDQLLNVLLAGRDTTAGLLGWTFWLLARDPAVYNKLRKTILDDFGSYTSPREITFATLKSCQYLQHVMNEVLRLYPSVPLNSRRAVRDTTIPRGGGPDGLSPVFIPKNREVNYSVHIMHRRRELWGDDAEQFKPERWEGRKPGWDYLPFNGGPRICLGQQFALTEAGYVIVRMMQKYDRIDRMNASDEPKHQYSVTTAPLTVDLRLHEAGVGDEY